MPRSALSCTAAVRADPPSRAARNAIDGSFLQPSQSLIVTRAGELVLFLGHRRVERIDQPNLWPELERFDIAISTAPEACKSPPGSCEFVYHDLRVTRRGESAVRSANGALQVGALTVVGSLFEGVNTFRFDSLHLGVNALGFVSPSRAGP